MNSIFIIKYVVNHLLCAIFALLIFLLTTLRVNSLFCRHINDIVNEFGVHCSHLIIIFLPFCSQFVSDIVTKFGAHFSFFLAVLLPFCNEFLPDIETILDELYYLLVAV